MPQRDLRFGKVLNNQTFKKDIPTYVDMFRILFELALLPVAQEVLQFFWGGFTLKLSRGNFFTGNFVQKNTCT